MRRNYYLFLLVIRLSYHYTTAGSQTHFHLLVTLQRIMTTLFPTKASLMAIFGALYLLVNSAAFVSASDSRVNVVLVGGSGDLAKKYLWQAFFEMHLRRPTGVSYRFWSADRSPSEKGAPMLAEILSTRLSCPSDMPQEACQDVMAAFTNACQHVQAKTEDHYVNIDASIDAATKSSGATETGRLFYLSVPPFAYSQIAGWVNAHARPAEGAWLRVGVEKPFGNDYPSALEMSKELSEVLSEEEIYRVDHYLGKRGVQQITAFRRANEDFFAKYVSKNTVERVEVSILEKADCAGRTRYYDPYGVVRDMHQNHISEIFSLVAMEMPSNGEDEEAFLAAKTAAMKAVNRVEPSQTLTGQYYKYMDHVRKDTPSRSTRSNTVTFAAASVRLNNARWGGTPFVLTSGKAMAQRTAYARIVFKGGRDGQVCLAPFHCEPSSITFQIQGGALGTAGTIVTGPINASIATPPGWTLEGSEALGARLYTPPKSLGHDIPYNKLVLDMANGNRDNFVSTRFLMASWKAWTPLIKALETTRPRRYLHGGAEVAFRLESGVPLFLFADREAKSDGPSHGGHHSEL